MSGRNVSSIGEYIMTEEATEVATSQLDQVVGKIYSVIEQTAMEYGEPAVELVLMAYQVNAWMTVGKFALFTIISIALARYMTNGLWKWVKEDESDGQDMPRVAIYFPVGIIFLFIVGGAIRNFDPITFAAAFGYPEILIAVKALTAVGMW